MGKNSHECLLSTTSCNVFSKDTRVRIVKLCQHLYSFRARCQTLTWSPGCHTGVPEHVFPPVLAISNHLEGCSVEQLGVLHPTVVWKVQESRHEQVANVPSALPQSRSIGPRQALLSCATSCGPLVMAQGLLLITVFLNDLLHNQPLLWHCVIPTLVLLCRGFAL